MTMVLGFLRLAAGNLLGYPLRSMLTTLGVVFGIASVATMLALGRGAEARILRDIDRLGVRNIILQSVKPADTKQGSAERRMISNYGLRFRDHAQIEETVPGLEAVLPVHSYQGQAWHGSRKEEVTVLGVTPRHLPAVNLRVVAGRGLSEDDDRERRTVCVVSLPLLRSIGWYGEPLGYKLRISEQVYEVVGVLETEEFQGLARRALASGDRSTKGENDVYVPYETVLARVGLLSMSRATGSFEASNIELNSIVAVVRREQDVIDCARMIRTVLRQSHADQDWGITVPVEILEQRRATQRTLNRALLAFAGITLLVGGIGIANIMLATVTERTREIGVRRAIGAKRRHIVGQFLTETVLLSVAGGIAGVALGWTASEVVSRTYEWESNFSADAALLAVSVSLGVGVLSGIFPAWRASRLDPLEALRYQ